MRFAVGLLLLLAACRDKSVPPPPAAYDAALIDASVATPKIVGRPNQVALLPNGHVLLSSRGFGSSGVLWDWNATTRGAAPTKVDVSADLGPGTSFFVERETEKGRFSLDLWDGPTLTKTKALGGEWTGERRAVGTFSKDGTRFLYARCMNVAEREDESACFVGTFAVPSGDLIHITSLPHLPSGRMYAPVFHLSNDGRYFDVSTPHMPALIFEASTGRTVFPTDGRWAGPQPESMGVKVLAIEGTVAVTSSNDKLVATDLKAGKELGHIAFGKTSPTNALASPDGKRFAVYLVEHDVHNPRIVDRARVGVWTVGAAKLEEHPIPVDMCVWCKLRWATNADVIVEPETNDVRPPHRLRVNVDPAVTSAGGPELLPTFQGDGFTLFLDAEKSAEEAPDGSAAVDVVVTPSGRRIETPAIVRPGTRIFDPQVAGDRLLVASTKLVRVFDRDGNYTELELTDPP